MKLKDYFESYETEMRNERSQAEPLPFATQFFDGIMSLLRAAYRNNHPAAQIRLNFGDGTDILTEYVDDFYQELKKDDITGVHVGIGFTEYGRYEFVVTTSFV